MRDDEIAREAWRREASHHAGHRNFRPHLRPRGANLMGLRGEEAFAERFGLEVDLSERLDGDGHVDLILPVMTSTGVMNAKINCKAALIPKDLIVDVEACEPDIVYVLCKYHPDEDRCSLLGWQWGAILMRSQPKDYGYGVINYWQPRGLLRTIEELEDRWVEARCPRPTGTVE